MSGVGLDRLQQIYAETDDPWRFRTSAYEQAKFVATRDALPRQHYGSALEIGCGNGELARHLAPRCARYHGVDAVERALAAARRAVPGGAFHHLVLPAPLPDGPHDLIVLSEILYFLDAPGIVALAAQIEERWPAADLVCVTWLGPSGNPLEGDEALGVFRDALPRALHSVASTDLYRIDVARGAA